MPAQTTPQIVDAVVIGAGFGGIYAVHKLHNELGLTVVGFDKADGPGGTWYWNRYHWESPMTHERPVTKFEDKAHQVGSAITELIWG
ncbi:NAD(P)-binding protein, partial [Rhodococcus koreensis]